MASSWDLKWKIDSELGGGAQGTTFLIRSLQNHNDVGVLKLLVKSKRRDDKARRRMHQEVANLQHLMGSGAKVPGIIDDNTHEFGNHDIDLYFVMEYAAGDSLEAAIKSRGTCSVDVAIDLGIDLASTIAICHAKSVMHRDLKPANIIVRGLVPADAVIVDYGLSFNENTAEQHDLTSGDEPIGNAFTDLPERRTPDAQRLYESDLTAVCGIVYYCITGHRPIPFRDAHGAPPHRRNQEGRSLREAMKGHQSTARLESVLDRAFETNIAGRFSKASELVERLRHAKDADAAPGKGLKDVLKDGSALLFKTSRKAQLVRFAARAQKVYYAINTIVSQLGDSEFLLRLVGLQPAEPPSGLPEDLEFLNWSFGIACQVQGINEFSCVEYCFVARGNEASLLRRRLRPHGDVMMTVSMVPTLTSQLEATVRRKLNPVEEWNQRVYYPGDGKPDDGELNQEIHAMVEWLVEDLTGRLQS